MSAEEPLNVKFICQLGFRFNEPYRRYELQVDKGTHLYVDVECDYITIWQGHDSAVGIELSSREQMLCLMKGVKAEIKE